ncbi:MAG: hypothetical protein WC588_00370 [Candidatus Micrarchaeia archaeon]
MESVIGISGKSLAFEVKGRRLLVKMEGDAPTVRLGGRTYSAEERPSVIVEGRKYPVDAIV